MNKLNEELLEKKVDLVSVLTGWHMSELDGVHVLMQ